MNIKDVDVLCVDDYEVRKATPADMQQKHARLMVCHNGATITADSNGYELLGGARNISVTRQAAPLSNLEAALVAL